AYYIAVILCGSVTAIYLIRGGSHSAILSDLMESILMLFGLLTLVISGVVTAGGLGGLNANIMADITLQGGFGSGGITITSSEAWFLFPNALSMGMIGMGLVTTFGTWGSPQMSTRFFAAKSRKSIRYGMLIAALWVFVVSFCAWFAGYVGRGQYITDVPGGTFIGATKSLQDFAKSLNNGTLPKNWYEYSMPWMLSESGFMPMWISALFLAGTTAASLTTGEKLVLVASGSVSRDFYQQGVAIKKNVSDEKTLKITRISIVCIIAIAVAIAINPPATVLDLCMFSWASLNAFTLIPFVAGLYWKGGTRRAALLSGIIALSVAILWFVCFYPKWAPINGQQILPLFKPAQLPYLFETPWFKVKPGDIHEFIVSQVVAIPAFFIISWIDKKGKPDREFLTKLFDHIKKDTDE
ncbi:MAG: sodium:solute symporter, partial [Candidatus Sigynarchaeum springense]